MRINKLRLRTKVGVVTLVTPTRNTDLSQRRKKKNWGNRKSDQNTNSLNHLTETIKSSYRDHMQIARDLVYMNLLVSWVQKEIAKKFA